MPRDLIACIQSTSRPASVPNGAKSGLPPQKKNEAGSHHLCIKMHMAFMCACTVRGMHCHTHHCAKLQHAASLAMCMPMHATCQCAAV